MYSGQLILEIDAAAAARQARLLPPTVWRLLRLFDGHRTLVDAVDDSPMDQAVTLAVVRRLTELGLVREAARAIKTSTRTQKLSSQTKKWIASKARARRRPDPFQTDDDELSVALMDDDAELEAALDEVLADLDAREPTAAMAPNLDAIPEAREHPLSDALQLAIEGPEWPISGLMKTLELSEKVRKRLEQVHDICDVPHGPMMMLDTPDLGFTNLELDFFNSYTPELPDDDDFLDLVMETAQRHG
jgi:hypothetical protein